MFVYVFFTRLPSLDLITLGMVFFHPVKYHSSSLLSPPCSMQKLFSASSSRLLFVLLLPRLPAHTLHPSLPLPPRHRLRLFTFGEGRRYQSECGCRHVSGTMRQTTVHTPSCTFSILTLMMCLAFHILPQGTVVDVQPDRLRLDDSTALLNVVLTDVVVPIDIRKGE